MSTAETDSADTAAPDFVLDPSDPLYMLLNNTHDTSPDMPFGFPYNPMDLDPSFSVFVDPNALFLNGKAPGHSTLQPQDLLNPFSFSSPTLSSASASPSGFAPSSPGSSDSARASPPAPALSRSTAGASDSVLE